MWACACERGILGGRVSHEPLEQHLLVSGCRLQKVRLGVAVEEGRTRSEKQDTYDRVLEISTHVLGIEYVSQVIPRISTLW